MRFDTSFPEGSRLAIAWIIVNMIFMAFVFVLIFGVRGDAQDMHSRAKTALSGANTGGAVFTDTRAGQTATAFSAGEPPQTSVDAGNIDTVAQTVLSLSSKSSDVYDGVQTRPRMVVDANDSRLSPGKWASTTGVSVIGDMETGAPRSCTFKDFGSAPPFQRTCDRFQDFDEPVCSVSLDVFTTGDIKDASACAAYDQDHLCTPTQLVCVSGPGTRMVNGVAETRLCWDWEQTYFCHAQGQISNCTPYETNLGCTEIQVDCLATNADGACSHESVLYECGNPDAQVDQSCGAIKVCEGEFCEGIPPEPDDDFTQAAAWLNVANEAAKDNNLLDASCDMGVISADGTCPSGEVRFFGGKRQSCGKAALGVKNCCKNSGIIVSLFDNCSDAELEIQQGFALKKTRYLGEYCSKKVLGFCIKRSLGYCNFESKFARVFQEEAKRTSSLHWDGAKTENCAGLTATDMAALDFDQIDLSELFGDLLADANLSDPASVNQRILDRMTGFGGGDPVNSTDAPTPDTNFDETEVVAVTNPDHVPETETTTVTITYHDCEGGQCNDEERSTTVTTTMTTPAVGDPYLFEEVVPEAPPTITYEADLDPELDRFVLPVTITDDAKPSDLDDIPSPINADQ